MMNEAKRMLVKGIVRHSVFPLNSPVVLCQKGDGSVRFAIDFRKVDKVTRKEPYPIPRIDDSLNSLGGGKLFTTLDLESAYWQVPLDEASIEKTAFSIPGVGHLEFVVMPYGLSNAGSCF